MQKVKIKFRKLLDTIIGEKYNQNEKCRISTLKKRGGVKNEE